MCVAIYLRVTFFIDLISGYLGLFKTSASSVVQCSEDLRARQEHSKTHKVPLTLSNVGPNVLKRELLTPQSLLLHSAHEEADLILQLGTVVTTSFTRNTPEEDHHSDNMSRK